MSSFYYILSVTESSEFISNLPGKFRNITSKNTETPPPQKKRTGILLKNSEVNKKRVEIEPAIFLVKIKNVSFPYSARFFLSVLKG